MLRKKRNFVRHDPFYQLLNFFILFYFCKERTEYKRFEKKLISHQTVTE